jgi:hypothetical protein
MPRKQETPHLRVRIEPRLLARLEKAREKSGHTLTGEIVSRLESSFRRDDHEELIAETVDKTLVAALRAMKKLENPPGVAGFLDGMIAGLTESTAPNPKTTGKQKD